MISLKRHIDDEQTYETRLRAMIAGYRQTLTAAGEAAAQASPSVETDVEAVLSSVGQEIATAETAAAIDTTTLRASACLRSWADRAEQDLRRKTADVKELLVTLTQTVANVAATDAEHVLRFDALTARLEKAASLADVAQLRDAVVASARELRASVDALSQSRRASMKVMQSELTDYQQRLEAAEKMAAHDPLTGLMNRRKIEVAIDMRIRRGAPFSIGLIDLDGFKQINDQLGHRAGDDVLRQVSADLKANSREGQVVGRWGGDEFIVIFDGSGVDAASHFKRLRQWVGGSYTIDGPHRKVKVEIDLSIGSAEWVAGTTAAQLVEQADQQMYRVKRSRV